MLCPRPLTFFALLAAPALGGCFGGAAGIGSLGGGGGGSSGAPAVSGLVVGEDGNPKDADEALDFRFELTGAGAAVRVEYKTTSDADFQQASVCGDEICSFTPDLSGLPPAKYKLFWNFDDDIDTASEKLVEFRVCTADGSSCETVVIPEVGNEPPQVTNAVVPTVEVSGLVPIVVTLDPVLEGDQVSVKGEYFKDGDWVPATPLGGQPIETVAAGVTAVDLTFFWNSAVDEPQAEESVLMRFTPQELVQDTCSLGIDDCGSPCMDCGAPFQAPMFDLDNNVPPVVVIAADELVGNPDSRFGIPIPITVSDFEGDAVNVVVQWAFEGQPFPDLFSKSTDEIIAIVGDPNERAKFNVVSELPIAVTGEPLRVFDTGGLLDPARLRLPELGDGIGTTQVAKGVAGRRLELLRRPAPPRAAPPEWTFPTTLDAPVGVVPIGSGPEAFVLDAASATQWRLRQVDLATGEEVSLPLLSDGTPFALARESADSLLIADGLPSGVWRIRRASSDASAVTTVAIAPDDGSVELGAVRGLASLGANTAAVTAGSSLIRVEYGLGAVDGEPRFTRLLSPPATPLSDPAGVLVDPRRPASVLVAERGADRVLAVDVRTRAVTPLVVDGPLLRPGALAYDPMANRLLVLADDAGRGGAQALVGMALDGAAGGELFTLGAPYAAGDLAAGGDGLVVVVETTANELSVAGGVAQRRDVTSYDSAAREVTLATPLEPPPAADFAARHTWRLRDFSGQVQATVAGARDVLVWDTPRDVPRSGGVLLKAAGLDADVGLAQATSVPVEIRHTSDADPKLVELVDPQGLAIADVNGDGRHDAATSLGALGDLRVSLQADTGFDPATLATLDPAGTGKALELGDVNADGRTDLVAVSVAAPERILVHLQTAPEVFGVEDHVLGSDTTTLGARDLVLADFDADGNLDVASANADGNDLAVFRQTAPGLFGEGGDPTAPLSVGGTGATPQPAAVAAGDLDDDGRVDLASANRGTGNVTLFHQKSDLVFGDGDPAVPTATLGTGAVLADARDLVLADLDRDGNLDVVAVSHDDNQFALFYQSVQFLGGPLLPDDVKGQIPFTNGPTGIAAADVDGNGFLDLVLTNNADPGQPEILSDNVAIFLQGLNGSFFQGPDLNLATQPIVAGGGPTGTVARDLNGDGELDVAVTFGDPDGGALGGLAYFPRATPGLFEPSGDLFLDGATISLGSTNPPFAEPGAIAAADVDADGDVDLVTANNGGETVTIFEQSQTGFFSSDPSTLGPMFTSELPDSGTERTAVVLSDWTGNGRVDVLAPELDADRVRLFTQTTDGTFGLQGDPTQANLVLTSSTGTRPASAAVGDVDDDGIPDVAVTYRGESGSGAEVGLYFGTGGGMVPDPARPDLTVTGLQRPEESALVDLDGDGVLDLVVADTGGDVVQILLQESPGVFGAGGVPQHSLTALERPTFVRFADVEGDGFPDVAVAGFDPSGFAHGTALYYQTDSGGFGPGGTGSDADLLLLSQGSTGTGGLALADLDEDGDADVVFAEFNVLPGSGIAIHDQVRPGRFVQRPEVLVGGEPAIGGQKTGGPLVVGDLDSDGNVDVAWLGERQTFDGSFAAYFLSVFFGSH